MRRFSSGALPGIPATGLKRDVAHIMVRAGYGALPGIPATGLKLADGVHDGWSLRRRAPRNPGYGIETVYPHVFAGARILRRAPRNPGYGIETVGPFVTVSS